jgi:hypothetical protein
LCPIWGMLRAGAAAASSLALTSSSLLSLLRELNLPAARTFLRWAAEHGLHSLPPEAIYEELRAPGVSRGIASFMAARRHLPSPPPATMPATLAAFGYPPGVAGLAQVAEEIHAFREALHDADSGRWGSLTEDRASRESVAQRGQPTGSTRRLASSCRQQAPRRGCLSRRARVSRGAIRRGPPAHQSTPASSCLRRATEQHARPYRLARTLARGDPADRR